jgi:RNA polymerase sigma factor (sigma-70 family)
MAAVAQIFEDSKTKELSTDSELDRLIGLIIDGAADAWPPLVAIVHPLVLAICRRRRLGGGESTEDMHRDVALRAIDRIQANDFAALRRYVATREIYAHASFSRWLAVVVGHTFVDYLRAQPEYQRVRQASARELVKIVVEPLDESTTASADRSLLQKVELRRIVAAMCDRSFPADQRWALRLWLDGNSAAEIAEEMALEGPEHAQRLLRAARQRLRRCFEDN